MFKIHLSHAIVGCVTSPQISLVLPVFNEERRVVESLQHIYKYLKSLKQTFEIIVVDDGSQDKTATLLYRFTPGKREIKILHLGRNSGKGAAVKQGMLASSGKYLFFSDIDLSVPISSLPQFLKMLQKGTDVAIASRRIPGSLVKIRQHSFRQALGHGFTKLSSLILDLDVSDVTCGFKGFSRKSARLLFSRSRIKRWAFDAEILYLARKLKLGIAEIPISWSNKQGTKVNIIKDLPLSLIELASIPWRHF